MSLDFPADRFDQARAQIRGAIGCVTAAWSQVAMTGDLSCDREMLSALNRCRDLLEAVDTAQKMRAEDAAAALAEPAAGAATAGA